MATGKSKKPKRSPKPDNPEQSRRFIEAAKKLGADETGEAFERAMRVLAKPKKSRSS